MVGQGHIRCGDCGKNQARVNFSKNQLNKFEERIGRKGKNRAELPNCNKCTGEPPSVLDCYGCNKQLPLIKFTKTQRRNKDKRLCIDCSQEKLDREPDVQDAIEEERIYEDLKANAGGADSVWSGSAMRSALPSIANGSALPSATNSRLNDEVWISQTSSARGNAVVQSSTSEEDETGTQLGSGTGTNRTNETWGWANSNAIEQQFRRGGQSVTSTVGWHKQGAVKATSEERAQARVDKEKGQEGKPEPEEELSSDADSSDGSDFEM